jgi:hypothetical protein
MDVAAFAAKRAEELAAGDEYLRPFVEKGLTAYANGEDGWEQIIVQAAGQIWLENYQAEAPGRPYERPLARFGTSVADSLEHTTQPDGQPSDGQVDRVTHWLSTYATNSGTVTGAFGHGVRFKRWVSMKDSAVREAHLAADGQLRPIGAAFDVGGVKLGFPGEPVGPPEVWINCRCVLMPASREGQTMTANTYQIGPEDVVDEDNPDIVEGYDAFAATDPGDIAVEPADEADLPDSDVPEDGEELITEIPVHGVLAPEGVATGDGREFADGALSTRNLPVPLRYEFESSHGGDNSRVATVGRVDEAWRDEASGMWRWRGVIVLAKAYAQEVIDGLVDGTVRGVSIDGDNAEIEIPEFADEDSAIEALLNPGPTIYTQMRTAGLTIVPIPAFEEAYIALGPDFQEDLSDADRTAQVAALQACGCLDGWGVVDLTTSDATDGATALREALRDFPAEARKKSADAGHAMPDGSFPIETEEDLRNAIQSIGRAQDPEAAKAHIKRRARELGREELIPEDWHTEPVLLSAVLEETFGTDFAPGTHDGPGWITHPVPTARIRRYWTRGKGAAKIRWGAPGDFNRCRMQLAKYVQNPEWLAGLCANMHYEALGFWPAQHHGSRVITAAGSRLAAPAARLAPVESVAFPAEWFQNPGLDRPVPLRIDPATRRVFGYLAEWGVCHVGIEGMCVDVPPSTSHYAYFLKGIVDTDAGEQPVGVISYGTGHADRFARAAVATAHYDKPDAVRAWINVGEDAYGIWFAGVLAPWVSEEDIVAMRAIGATSGDWREVRGQLELIGLPVVNTPGYPVRALAASGGKQITLIGAGALPREKDSTGGATLTLTSEMIDDIASRAIAKMRRQQELAARVEPAREAVKRERLAAARAQLERI